MNFHSVVKLRNLVLDFSTHRIRNVTKPQTHHGFKRSCSNKPEIPHNVIGHIYSASHQPQNGKIYERKPFRMRLYPKKNYMWCLCGHSKSQPICDGSHNRKDYKCTIKPVKFQVAEEGDYWLCNCKQTKLRPFCDGTHKEV